MANMGWLISMVNISINTSNQPKTIQCTLCWDSMTFGKTFTCHHSYWTRGIGCVTGLPAGNEWPHSTFLIHFPLMFVLHQAFQKIPVSTWLSATSWEKIDRHEEFRVTEIKGIIRGVLSVLTRQWLWMTGSQARISRLQSECPVNTTVRP